MEDHRNEPLIAAYTASPPFLGPAFSAAQPSSVPRPRDYFVGLLTFSAGISGLLFGYDTGVISATLVSIDDSLSHRRLTPWDKSIITSSTALFALYLSPLSSVLADRLGRKCVILMADILFVLGALVQALSNHVSTMVLGRSAVGAAVGAASFVVPLYMAELAPAASRGCLVTMNVVFITLGQVVAYLVGWAFAEHGDRPTGWRCMVRLGALPALFQLVLVLFMPETPRWLVKAGRSQDARLVLAQISGPGPESGPLVEATVKSIELEMRQEDEARRLRRHGPNIHDGPQWLDGWRELVTVRRNRRALLIACLLQGLQQLCGFNSLMYFSGTIFQLAGFYMPTRAALVVAVTNLVFTVVALLLVDRVGRRRILLASLPVMVVGLLLAAYGFSYMELPGGSYITTRSESTSGGAAHNILISIMLYVAGYAIGLGTVPWMQSELFTLHVRSLGSGLATATNWGANFLVGLTFLILMDALGPSWTFVLYAMVCVGGYGLIWILYPETNGLSLEQAANRVEPP